MGKATVRQIAYAKAIAEELCIEYPDEETYESISEFISKYKETHARKQFERMIRNDSDAYMRLFMKSDDVEEFMNVNVEKLISLYKKSGIYAFLGRKKEILYIGKSKNLGERIPSSYSERRDCKKIHEIKYYLVPNLADVNILEILLIVENKPYLNKESNCKELPTMFKSNLDIIKDFKTFWKSKKKRKQED